MSRIYSDVCEIEIDAQINTIMYTQLQAINSGGLTASKGFKRHRTKPTANACHP